MFPRILNQKTLGLSLNEGLLKCVIVSQNQNKVKIHFSDTVEINCKAALQKFQKKMNSFPSASFIFSKYIYTSSFKSNIANKKDLASSLKFNIESKLSSNNLIIEKTFIRKDNESDLFTAFALPKPYFNSSQGSFKAFIPDFVCPSAVSILSFLKDKVDLSNKRLIVYLDFEHAECILCEDKKILKTYPVSSPLDKKHTFDEELSLFIKNMSKSLFAIFSKSPSLNHEIYLIGSLANKEKAIAALIEQTPYTFKRPSIDEISQNYLLEIGSALNYLSSIKEQVNFNGNAAKFLPVFKRYKNNLLFSFYMMLLLFSGSLIFWKSNLKSNQNHNDLLYTEILKEQNLTREGINSKLKKDKNLRIETLQVDYANRKSLNFNYNLSPTTFLVSDIFAWLTTLYQELQQEGFKDPFVIHQFKYKLASYPNLKKQKQPYQVKLDLSFSISSPQVARKLHQKLLNSKNIINDKSKISWTYQSELYQTSFVLKNYSTPLNCK